MKRVLHFRSRTEKYHCDAVVVACFDHRFDLVLRKFLKRTDRVILLLHSDCGAYGGLHQVFRDDEVAEVAHHKSELQKAHSVLKAAFPRLCVECYFVDFAGVWQLDSAVGLSG